MMPKVMQTMLPPVDAINLTYDSCNVVPGEPVEVYVRDLESLKAEGWISTEPEVEPETDPPRRPARRSKKASK